MSSALYTANIASRFGRTGLVKFLQCFRSIEYSHLHNSWSNFIADINRSGEKVETVGARGDSHGYSARCGRNSRLSAVRKICALPHLLPSQNNWIYSEFSSFRGGAVGTSDLVGCWVVEWFVSDVLQKRGGSSRIWRFTDNRQWAVLPLKMRSLDSRNFGHGSLTDLGP